MNDQRRARAVVFDLDGLIFNTEELYQDVGGEILRRRGREFTPELLDAMMGRPNRVALQIMIDWNALDATVEQLAAETEEIFRGMLEERLALMPGCSSLLGAIESAGLPRAIATSSPRAFVRRVLGQFELEPRFDFILAAEDVTVGKPNPEIYHKAAQQFGLPPAEVLVLEDSQVGCSAAIAAGAIAVAVPGSHSLRHDFSGAALVADTLCDPRIYKLLGLTPESFAS